MAHQLVVVGTGIQVGHLTAEAKGWLSCADKVLYCVADAATERMIVSLNKNSESMFKFYGEKKNRRETYQQMIDRTIECLREAETLCVAYYGHPGFFVYPSHKAIALAREMGFGARMLPGVSSLDCLLCDLGIEAAVGLQVYEATDFMLRRRKPDTSTHIVVFQVSALGDLSYSFDGYDLRHLPSLAEHLLDFYPPDFVVKAYHAPHFPVAEHVVVEMALEELARCSSSLISTIYIPPFRTAPVHLDILKQYEMDHFLEGVRLIPINADENTHFSK